MKYLKKYLPPELIRLGRHIMGYGSCFRGEFQTWEEAASLTQGYNADQILEKVLENTIKVRDKKAEFERDSVLFYERDDRYPLLAALMRCAAENGGNLRVLDFGGGLGSAYFQHRHWLEKLPSVKWCVVEQGKFVEAGNSQIADGDLFFAKSIAEATKVENFDIVVFSGVLQYLKDFSGFIVQAISIKPKYILIDRQPMIEGEKDIISLQKQSGRIVRSSYPLHLLTKNSLLKAIGDGYLLLSEFNAFDEPMGGIKTRVDYKGFLFERIKI